MAIPNNYIDKITKDGDSRPICPPAEHVRVENDNFEGESLDEVLDEISESLGEAGKGSVNAVKVGSTPYTPDGEGVVDLSTPFGGKVDKVTGKGLSTNDYTDAEKNKLAGIAEGATANVGTVTGIKYNDGSAISPINGVVDLGTIQGQQGPKGDTGNCQITGDGSNIVSLIVNDLTTGGAGNMLSAEMGKRLKALIDAYESRIDALEESGAALVSVEGTTLVISRMNEPVVIVGDMTKDALTSVAGGESITSDFFVSGRNLEGNIGITLSDATNFSVVPTQLVPSDGKVQTTMVSVKFNPAAGLAAGSTHSCTVTVTYGGVTKKTMTIDGTVAASASLSFDSPSLTIKAATGAQNHGTVTLQGVALSGDVELELTGTGLSFDAAGNTTQLIVTRADAENGINIDIYYTAGASDVNGSLTATSGTASASAEVNGVLAVRLNTGDYFDVPVAAGGTLRYTVLADNTTVSVKKGSTNPVGTAANPLVIPSTICDDDASAVYDSGGGTINAGGMTYNVVETPTNAFELCTGIVAVRISEGFTKFGQGTFGNCANLKTLILPNSLQMMNGYVFNNSGLEDVEIPACTISPWGLSGAKSLVKVTFKGTTLVNTSIGRNMYINEIHINGCDQSAANWNNPFDQCTQFTDGTYPDVYVDSVSPPAFATNATIFPMDNGVIKAKLHVPVGSESDYRAASVWGSFEYINNSTN